MIDHAATFAAGRLSRHLIAFAVAYVSNARMAVVFPAEPCIKS